MLPEQAWGLVPETMPERIPRSAARLLDAPESNERPGRELRSFAWAESLQARFQRRMVEGDPFDVWRRERVWVPGRSRRGPRTLGEVMAASPVDLRAGFLVLPARLNTYHARGPRLRLGELPRLPKGVMSVPHSDGGALTFGVVVEVDVSEWADDFDLTYYLLVDTLGDEGDRGSFPVFLRLACPRPSAPPHPTGQASAACWVVPRRPAPSSWSLGILTARHVLPSSSQYRGAPIRWVDEAGDLALVKVADIAGNSMIDAAVLEATPFGPAIRLGGQLPVQALTAPGQTVRLELGSGTVSASVLEVTPCMGGYLGQLVADRILVDTAGVHGDSGALVSDAHGQLAVGLYVASVPPGHGLLQTMRQVSTYFDLDLRR